MKLRFYIYAVHAVNLRAKFANLAVKAYEKILVSILNFKSEFGEVIESKFESVSPQNVRNLGGFASRKILLCAIA